MTWPVLLLSRYMYVYLNWISLCNVQKWGNRKVWVYLMILDDVLKVTYSRTNCNSFGSFIIALPCQNRLQTLLMIFFCFTYFHMKFLYNFTFYIPSITCYHHSQCNNQTWFITYNYNYIEVCSGDNQKLPRVRFFSKWSKTSKIEIPQFTFIWFRNYLAWTI